MAISNELLASTLNAIVDSERDALYQGIVFLDWSKKLGKVEEEDGGTRWDVPVAVAEHSNITVHTTGYEAQDMVLSDVLQPAQYEPYDFSAPVGLSHLEELRNSGEKKIISLMEARTRSAMALMKRELNKQILAGNSAVLSGFGTLNGEASTTGIIEAGAPAAATQTNTIGGIQKSVVNVVGWYNQYGTAAGAFSTNGLAQMQAIVAKCNARADRGQVNLTIMSEAGLANYRRALNANERYVDADKLDVYRPQLAFAGGVIEQDLYMPTNTAVGTNEYTAYFLNLDGIKLHVHKDANFALGSFDDRDGFTVRTATIYFSGALCAHHIGGSGVLINGDTW